MGKTRVSSAVLARTLAHALASGGKNILHAHTEPGLIARQKRTTTHGVITVTFTYPFKRSKRMPTDDDEGI